MNSQDQLQYYEGFRTGYYDAYNSRFSGKDRNLEKQPDWYQMGYNDGYWNGCKIFGKVEIWMCNKK